MSQRDGMNEVPGPAVTSRQQREYDSNPLLVKRTGHGGAVYGEEGQSAWHVFANVLDPEDKLGEAERWRRIVQAAADEARVYADADDFHSTMSSLHADLQGNPETVTLREEFTSQIWNKRITTVKDIRDWLRTKGVTL